LNTGEHLRLVYRLRATLWRAAAYPLVILCALSLIVAFIGLFIVPQFQAMFDGFNTSLPSLTRLLLYIGPALPVVGLSVVALVLLMPILWGLLVAAGWDRPVIDTLLLPLPAIGPILKHNLVARWCDVLKLAVEA